MATSTDRTAVSAMSLDDLELYLDAYPDPRIERMGVSFIDGFLAATIVGPHVVPQARWLFQIFGAKLPGSHGDRTGAAAIAAWTSPEKVEGFSDRVLESEEQEWASQRRTRGA